MKRLNFSRDNPETWSADYLEQQILACKYHIYTRDQDIKEITWSRKNSEKTLDELEKIKNEAS